MSHAFPAPASRAPVPSASDPTLTASSPAGDAAGALTLAPVNLEHIDAAAEQVWNDAVFDGAPVAAPVLRLWRYRAPAVVLGRSQRALGRRAPALAPASDPKPALVGDRADLPLIERRAGGGAVLVGPWMLGMSLVVPVDHRWVAGRGIGTSYVDLGEAFTGALRSLGVVNAKPATEDEARRAPAGLEWACFAGVTAQEILVDGRKLVGLAQRRHRHGVLFVAGVLVDPVPWSLLADAMLPLVGAEPDAGEGARAAAGLAAETISLAEARGAAVAIETVATACSDAIVIALSGRTVGRRVG